MSHVNRGSLRGPVSRIRQSMVGEPGLPFASWMDLGQVQQTLDAHDVAWRDDVFTPMVTLQAFVGQVMDDHRSCQAAVARVLAWRIGSGQPACSARTGGYCQARMRLPEAALHALMHQVGRRLHEEHAPARSDLLGGRPIKIVDGSTVSMPDTPANQQAYPQARTQKPGLGFPLARIMAMFDLFSGAVLDAAIGPYKGKQTGENALFRGLFHSLQPGDLVAGDCGFGSFWNFAMLQQRGVDAIFPLHQCRAEDFRRGKRLGQDDRQVQWRRPARPEWMDEQTYQSLPDTLTLRQVRVRINVPGFRVRTLTLVTTLLDPREYPREELAEVYRARWHAELDLRTIKSVMAMDVLRCQTPAMVRKEFWTHLLAYNLIRTVMAQAAASGHCTPRQISFTSAWQTLRAFAPLAPSHTGDPAVFAALLTAIASHRVGHRPDRIEPRAVKRRPKPLPLLTEPRPQARKRLQRAA